MSTPEYIVVGVVPGQPDAVVEHAAAFARQFGATLACAWVDSGRFELEERADGSIVSMPIDPEISDAADLGFPAEIAAQIERLLRDTGVPWVTRECAGDPASALGRLAGRLGAAMIIVGTHESGVRGSLQTFFGGSTAVHLAHRQHRPVVVIPLNPVPLGGPLPWEAG